MSHPSSLFRQALFLILYAFFIWIRDLFWLTQWEESLFHFIAFPAFFWLAHPWVFSSSEKDVSDQKKVFPFFSQKRSIIALTLFFFGSLLDITLFFALSWMVLAVDFFTRIWSKPTFYEIQALGTVFVMGFPWMETDGRNIGWYFRLSSGYFAEKLLALGEISVKREGTFLLVNNVSISIEEACSGMNGLQTMLLAGILINYLYHGGSRLFWMNLPWLFVVGWFANLIRILFFVLVAIKLGPEYAKNLFHVIGGTVLVTASLLLLVALFSFEKWRSNAKSG